MAKLRAVPTAANTGLASEERTPRLSLLMAARNSPITVAREAPIQRARTLMLRYDFSQLPVMNGERTLHGMISWRSIGRNSIRRNNGAKVADFLDPNVTILPSTTPLLDAIAEVVKHDVILVRDRSKVIVGIVTAADLSKELLSISEGFLLLGEIESRLRRLARGRFKQEELQQVQAPHSTRTINDVDDLAMGEFVRLLAHPANWTRLDVQLDRSEFVECLEKVRLTRNAIMHFRTEPIQGDHLIPLREMLRLLEYV